MKKTPLFLGLIFMAALPSFAQDSIPAPTSCRVNGVTFNMVRVEKGEFWMGAQHKDTADINYDRKKCPKRPVTNVNYFEVQEFIRILDSLTGLDFRLPTEEEWEFAARGGNHSRGYVYSGGNESKKVAWHNGNARNIRKVKKRKANELGIYDMSGNVWEWCSTTYRFYDKERNAHLGKDGEMHVIRGGAWQLPESSCRVAWRGKRLPELQNSFGGFRLCLDAKYVKEEPETKP